MMDWEQSQYYVLWTLVMDVAKIAYMYYTEVEAMADLKVIIPFTALAVYMGAMCSVCFDKRSCGLVIAIGLTAPTAFIKWIEHITMTFSNEEVDVNRCALVSIFELFK